MNFPNPSQVSEFPNPSQVSEFPNPSQVIEFPNLFFAQVSIAFNCHGRMIKLTKMNMFEQARLRISIFRFQNRYEKEDNCYKNFI